MRLEKEQRKCFEKGIEAVETVEHLLFHCPNYDDIRADFSCLNYTIPDIFEFLQQLGNVTKKCCERHRELNPFYFKIKIIFIKLVVYLVPYITGDSKKVGLCRILLDRLSVEAEWRVASRGSILPEQALPLLAS